MSPKLQRKDEAASTRSKEEMSIGSAESLSPRWITPDKKNHNGPGNIHWAGVLRDDTMLAEFMSEDNPKIMQISRRFLKKKEPRVDWEFKTYAVQSQRRMVHAIKFYVYEKIPLKAGARAKLQNLKQQTFLNNASVRIIEYNANTEKYLIRPSIPLPEAQKLATTGMLIVPPRWDQRLLDTTFLHLSETYHPSCENFLR